MHEFPFALTSTHRPIALVHLHTNTMNSRHPAHRRSTYTAVGQHVFGHASTVHLHTTVNDTVHASVVFVPLNVVSMFCSQLRALQSTTRPVLVYTIVYFNTKTTVLVGESTLSLAPEACMIQRCPGTNNSNSSHSVWILQNYNNFNTKQTIIYPKLNLAV